MNAISHINSEQLKQDIPPFSPGDTVRVHQLIQEGTKERVQIFEGVVLRRNGGGVSETFTVRKVSYNVGVERVYPLHSPRISKIEVKQRGSVRRARLYYLRERSGKAAKIREERYSGPSKEAAAPIEAAAHPISEPKPKKAKAAKKS